jgi:hypothetical protein
MKLSLAKVAAAVAAGLTVMTSGAMAQEQLDHNLQSISASIEAVCRKTLQAIRIESDDVDSLC